MIKPQGLSAGPLLLAVVALVVASVSFGLHTGAAEVTEGRAATGADTRERIADAPARRAAQYRRVAGPVTTLAPAGNPSGDASAHPRRCVRTGCGSSRAVIARSPAGARLLQRRPHRWSSGLDRGSGERCRNVGDGAGLCILRSIRHSRRSGHQARSRQAARRGEAGGGGCDRQVQDSPRRATLTAAGRRSKLCPHPCGVV